MKKAFHAPSAESSAAEEGKAFYRASDNFLMRTIAGDTILVPVGEQTKKLNGFVTFTETGQFLWKLLSEQKCTAEDLVDGLLQEYSGPEAEIRADVEAFLKKTVDHGMVVRCG
ncbi:MAG: PqqD family protein [Hominenteromicrobium sp.]